MPDLREIKRRVLHEAVQENLATMRGLPPPHLRRGRRVARTTLKTLLLVVVPSAVFLALNVLVPRGGATPSAIRPTPPAAAASVPGAFPVPPSIDPAAFPLGVRKIVLDPGHGGRDLGAVTQTGLREKDLTLDVARRLRRLLVDQAFEVALTRESDEAVSLRDRARFANAERADLFVSIHVNSVPARDCHAVETYYLGGAADPAVERLAGQENRESGYSLADFRRLLEGVYTHVRQEESRRLAEATHRQLVGLLGDANPALRDLGVKTAPFLVLVATGSPGILAEVSCLADDEEARLLADADYREKIARGLFLGIRAYAEAKNRLARQGS
jgi:N-acetylmuramoyl-L-alanine amidase